MKHKRILAWLLTISISTTLVFGFMLTADAANGRAQIPNANTADAESEAVTFIVEVEGDPLAVQSGIAAMSDTEKTEELLDMQQRVMSRINTEVDTTAKKGFVYTAVFNGFSVDGSIDQLDEIKALDGVKNVYISSEIQIIEPVEDGEATPMLDSAEEMTNVNDAHTKGYDGEGTVIAIIDIGCDTSHEFFKTDPVNPRYSKEDIDTLVKTLSLNADAESGNQVYKNAKIPYAYNYTEKSADTYIHSQSHGTHVAGIAAGKDGVDTNGELFSGVAPEAQLFILSCGTASGYINTAASLAAINDAVLMKADVINMSFGGPYVDVSYTDFYTNVLNNCREAGVSVIAANGNDGRGYADAELTADKPDYSTGGLPCGESAATAVAAVDNTSQWYESLVTPDDVEYHAHLSNESDSLEAAYSGLAEGAYLEYVDCGHGKDGEFSNVSGKLALIKRGGDLSFSAKASNAKAAGAVGILIYNNEEEIIDMVELGMPAVFLTLSEGESLLARAEKRLRYNGERMMKKTNSGPTLMTYYSSWGVGSTLELKPEISAPGEKIYSSIPDNKYKSLGGTSMAAPHMAGIAALSRQYYKENPFSEEFNGKTGAEMTYLIENLAMNSATIVRQENGVAYSPRVQGAGLVDMEGILNSRVLLTGDSGKAKLSLGDDLTDTINLAFDITNISKEDITFDKISVEVLTDGYEKSGDSYLISDSVAINTEVEMSEEIIKVLTGETAKFEAEVKLDADFLAENEKIFTNGFFIDGYVILESEADSTLKASLPFTGFYGDWGLAPIFDSTIYDEGGSYLVNASAAYETGTYLEAGYEQGTITLGRNPFFPKILDEKYIAYSTNSGPSLNLIMTNLRALKNPVISIINSDKTAVTNAVGEGGLPKYTPLSYKLAAAWLSGIEEGQYTFSVKATVAGDTEQTDELCIPFTLDNTYPKILSVVYERDEKTVTVTAKENHYFSAFYIAYPGESGQQYRYIQVADADYTQDGSATKVIDVSMIEDISQAEIGCVDYALNQTYYDMDYFLDKAGAELTALERLGSMTQAEFNIKNNTSRELSGDFVLAFYDDTHRLIATSAQNYKIAANAEDELTYEFFANTQDAAYVKLFVWDIEQSKPVDALKQFDLN